MKRTRFIENTVITLNKVTLLLLMLCIVMLFVACQSGNAGKTITCTVAVFGEEDNVILSETEITCPEGQSVLDVLKKATKDAGIQMEYIGTGVTAYVQGIDNLYEFDKGPESGWIYSVNDEVIQESAGACGVAEGDAVVWRYVLQP